MLSVMQTEYNPKGSNYMFVLLVCIAKSDMPTRFSFVYLDEEVGEIKVICN